MNVVKLRFKINLIGLLVLFFVALIYGSILYSFEIERRQKAMERIEFLLHSLAQQSMEELANEVFSDQKKAVERSLQKLMKVKGIYSIRVFLRDGRLLTFTGKKGPTFLPFPTRDRLEKSDSVFEEKESSLPIASFSILISSLGEKVGFLEIDYLLVEEMEQTKANIIIFFTLLVTILLVFSWILNFLLGYYVIRPVNKLRIGMRKVQEGYFGEKISLISQDEIGELADSFNFMSTTLEKLYSELDFSHKRLEEYSHSLEERVSERAQEIKDKNKELKKTLKLLKEVKGKMVIQEKMASLGELTAGIAHEIKNPLNFVINFADLSLGLFEELLAKLRKGAIESAPNVETELTEIIGTLEHNIKKIIEHGKRADDIIQGMLLHSKTSSGKKQWVEINELLQEFIQLALNGMKAKKHNFDIDIKTNFDEKALKGYIIPQDISRVFLNILNNACYATQEKQKENKDFIPQLTIQTREKGNQIEIRFRDNGIGVPKGKQKKLFHPFFSTKPSREGTGLGLSISYDIIVNQHQGEIRCESEEGKYTDFIITLPQEPIVIEKE